MYSALVLFALCNLLYLALHVTGSGSFPKPLSAKEERECLAAIRNGDQAARNKLIEHNLRLVAHIIKKYYSTIREQDDLISIGTIGLIKAVSTFDYDKGTRFATYASRCIENAILRLLTQKPPSGGKLRPASPSKRYVRPPLPFRPYSAPPFPQPCGQAPASPRKKPFESAWERT